MLPVHVITRSRTCSSINIRDFSPNFGEYAILELWGAATLILGCLLVPPFATVSPTLFLKVESCRTTLCPLGQSFGLDGQRRSFFFDYKHFFPGAHLHGLIPLFNVKSQGN